MPRRQPVVETDNLTLSFLDLISCGLGGAIFLSLLFSIVRQDRPTPLIADPFLDVTLISVEPAAVLNLAVTPPAGPTYFLPLSAFDPVTGLLPREHKLNQSGKVMLLGFSPFGDAGRVLVKDKEDTSSKQGQYYKLLIHDPRPGAWTIEAVYRDWGDWRKPPPLVQVRRSALTHKKPFDPVEAKLAFGEATSFRQPLDVDNPRFRAKENPLERPESP